MNGLKDRAGTEVEFKGQRQCSSVCLKAMISTEYGFEGHDQYRVWVWSPRPVQTDALGGRAGPFSRTPDVGNVQLQRETSTRHDIVFGLRDRGWASEVLTVLGAVWC